MNDLFPYEKAAQEYCVMEDSAAARDSQVTSVCAARAAHGDLVIETNKFSGKTPAGDVYCAHVYYYKRKEGF